ITGCASTLSPGSHGSGERRMSTAAAALNHLRVPDHARSQWFSLVTALGELGPAACEGADPDGWWPRGRENREAALTACGRCPVQPECRAYALAAGEQDGIWGGLLPEERRR